MKKVYTAKDIKDLVSQGASLDSIPAGSILTPSAKDAIKEQSGGSATASTNRASNAQSSERFPSTCLPVFPLFLLSPSCPAWNITGQLVEIPTNPEQIQRFFHSPEIMKLKDEMIRVARKMWQRNMVDGNGGNITVRVGDNLVLCTPTLRSKGEVQADEIALIDLEGNQKAGWRKRTSEANTHLAIMKVQPKCKSVIHGHPPYSTAFAVARVEPPTCLCSEVEVFTGAIRLVEYHTQEVLRSVKPSPKLVKTTLQSYSPTTA